MAARKRGISIDFSGFEGLIERLEKLGADIGDIIAEAMEQTAILARLLTKRFANIKKQTA